MADICGPHIINFVGQRGRQKSRLAPSGTDWMSGSSAISTAEIRRRARAMFRPRTRSTRCLRQHSRLADAAAQPPANAAVIEDVTTRGNDEGGGGRLECVCIAKVSQSAAGTNKRESQAESRLSTYQNNPAVSRLGNALEVHHGEHTWF